MTTPASEATCKTCPFFGGWRPGGDSWECRRRPLLVLEEKNPETKWCGEHPLRQRDRLAAMAMQGWLSSWPSRTWLAGEPVQLAAHAYRVADAMLAAAAKAPGGT